MIVKTLVDGGIGMVMVEIVIKMILTHLLQLEVLKSITELKHGLKHGKEMIQKDVVLL